MENLPECRLRIKNGKLARKSSAQKKWKTFQKVVGEKKLKTLNYDKNQNIKRKELIF
jgi:hypothetical protein